MDEMAGTITEINRIGAEELTFEWQVKGILSVISGWEIDWLSPEIEFDNEFWWLRILSNWRNPATRCLSLCLVRGNVELPTKTFHVSVSLVVCGGVETTREVEKVFSNLNNTLLWEDFCSISELIGQQSVMLDGVLTVRCNIKAGTARANELRRQVNVLEDKIEEYEYTIHDLKELINQSDEDIKKYRSSNGNLKKWLLTSQKDYAELLTSKCNIAFKFKKENVELKKEVKVLKERIEEYKEKMNEYDDDLKSHKSLNDDFKKKISAQEDCIAQMGAKCSIASKLEKENCDYKAKIDKLKEDNQALLRKKKKLEKENKLCEMGFKKKLTKHLDYEIYLRKLFKGDITDRICDFGDLYCRDPSPNLVLKCDGWCIPVNTYVLSVRSTFFRDMFRNRAKNEMFGSVEIGDIDVSLLLSMLKFLYCGKLERMTENTVAALYAVSEKYSRSLNAECHCWLVNNLTQENCISFLKLADSLSDNFLEEEVQSFIVSHPHLLKTAAWLEFGKEHLKLACRVLQAYASSTLPKKE